MTPHVPAPFLFVDVEASSLREGGFPIEVAWVTQDGACESHLVRPREEWREWSAQAASLHGLTRGMLRAHGRAAQDVARRFVQAAHARRVVSDAVAFDGAWLSMLCEAAGLVAPTLLPVQLAYAEAVAPFLDRAASRPAQARMALQVVARHEAAQEACDRVRHRALPDAWALFRTWRAIAGASVPPAPPA
ncbi:transcriptional regulator [Novacetimonas maltaceti]|uniref:Exonuclease domain-containing protein n=1 Tax=Novacetimonas maltaceti TaxID=1203393 RepID=A0A2S3W186_9PROT|nr:transcriptional regulator [Novacetimonas maltaceti]POF62313.1 hypothetical protein KMAL_20320 [Novacetimonas maltaceti]PYD60448.1 transcriptional regulator [Novacetimonas maltaceti]